MVGYKSRKLIFVVGAVAVAITTTLLAASVLPNLADLLPLLFDFLKWAVGLYLFGNVAGKVTSSFALDPNRPLRLKSRKAQPPEDPLDKDQPSP